MCGSECVPSFDPRREVLDERAGASHLFTEFDPSAFPVHVWLAFLSFACLSESVSERDPVGDRHDQGEVDAALKHKEGRRVVKPIGVEPEPVLGVVAREPVRGAGSDIHQWSATGPVNLGPMIAHPGGGSADGLGDLVDGFLTHLVFANSD